MAPGLLRLGRNWVQDVESGYANGRLLAGFTFESV